MTTLMVLMTTLIVLMTTLMKVTETLMAIDALLAKRPPTPPLLATALDDEDDEEGIESVDGTLSQLLQAEAAVAEAEAEAAAAAMAEAAEAPEEAEAEAPEEAEVMAEEAQPVASARRVGRGFARTEAPNTAPSTAPSSGEAACVKLLGELGELQSPALELPSPALELDPRGAQYGASAARSAVMSAVEEDELVYQGGGASQGSQGSQGSRERVVTRLGLGQSVEGSVEGGEDEAPASHCQLRQIRQLRQLRQLGAEDEALGDRAGALGGEDFVSLGGEGGEGAAGPSLAHSYADETLDDEAQEWRETLELLITALPRLPPEQASLVNCLIKTPSQY